MHRRDFLQDLADYNRTWGAGRFAYPGLDRSEEEALAPLFLGLVTERTDCFERTCVPGHVTGSALVLSSDMQQVLLTLHGKLNLWLQLGGHADGEPWPHAVALREATEESGLNGLTHLSYEEILCPQREAERPLPFDLDRHLIPARKGEPEHYHYDVRYLVLADAKAPLGITEESKDLRWFPFAEARRLTRERSMIRQFDKAEWLRDDVLRIK